MEPPFLLVILAGSQEPGRGGSVTNFKSTEIPVNKVRGPDPGLFVKDREFIIYQETAVVKEPSGVISRN